MSDLTPITREEMLLDGQDLEPITRKEMFIKRIYDKTQVIPEPITREEIFLKKAGDETTDVTIEQLTATENRTYSEEGVAYSPVIVNVPQTTLTTLDVTENGTYTAPSGTAYDEVDVNVPLPENAYLLKDIPNTPTTIATFSDGANLPMPKLKVGIEPVQSGSGDPSPTNIRPISGWDEVDVTRTGKNLYSHNGISIYDYAFSQQIAFSQMRNPIFMKGGQKYVLSLSENITLFRMRAFDKFQNLVTNASIVNAYNQGSETGLVFYANGNFFGYNGAGANSITTFQPTEDIWFDMTVQTTSPSQIMFEIGDTPSTYESYNGSTYTIDLNGTRYGGTLDVVSGVLTVDRAYVDLGSLSYTYEDTETPKRFRTGLNPPPKLSSELVCSCYKGVVKSVAALNNGECCISGTAAYPWLRIRDDAITDATTFKTSVNGQQLVYELATPLTIQLTPTQVSSLMGVNNVWADCGDIIDGQYFSKEV